MEDISTNSWFGTRWNVQQVVALFSICEVQLILTMETKAWYLYVTWSWLKGKILHFSLSKWKKEERNLQMAWGRESGAEIPAVISDHMLTCRVSLSLSFSLSAFLSQRPTKAGVAVVDWLRVFGRCTPWTCSLSLSLVSPLPSFLWKNSQKRKPAASFYPYSLTRLRPFEKHWTKDSEWKKEK